MFDGTRVNVFHANLNEGLPAHSHEYAHITACYHGKLKVTKENVEVILDKDSQPVILKAGEWHELEAVEDGTVFSNIFADEFMKTDKGY